MEIDTRSVRAWLRQNGIQISDRGRIPSGFVTKYQRAHGIEPIPDDQGRELPLLPHYRDLCALLVRTDFSDDDAWRAVLAAIEAPTRDGFQAVVEVCENRAFAGLTKDQLMTHLPNNHRHTVLFVVGAVTIGEPEHPLLVIDVSAWESPGTTLRAIPSAVQSISDNLNIANMWFRDFAAGADPDGIVRLY